MGKECKFCDKVWAGFGMLLGVVFVYVSIDLLTNGRISGMLSRTPGEEISDDVTE